jgi:hypothetical protein
VNLFDLADRQMADTSLDAYAGIVGDIQKREKSVLLALFDYVSFTGHADCTGGELTEYMRLNGLARDVNGVRPRLTMMQKKGWLISLTKRRCRAYGTLAHPYAPTMPRAAIERMKPK